MGLQTAIDVIFSDKMGLRSQKQNIIVRVELDGLNVHADILPGEDEEFALSMLEKYLQVNYPGANISIEYTKWQRFSDRVKLTFANEEDAMHFYLSH